MVICVQTFFHENQHTRGAFLCMVAKPIRGFYSGIYNCTGASILFIGLSDNHLRMVQEDVMIH